MPDSTINVDYCIKKFTKIIRQTPGLSRGHDGQYSNKTGGLIYSQRIMLAIVNKGVLREDAYKWVQRNAMKRWMQGEDFRTNARKE